MRVESVASVLRRSILKFKLKVRKQVVKVAREGLIPLPKTFKLRFSTQAIVKSAETSRHST